MYKGLDYTHTFVEKNGGCTTDDCNNSKWTPWIYTSSTSTSTSTSTTSTSTDSDSRGLILNWKILAALAILIK